MKKLFLGSKVMFLLGIMLIPLLGSAACADLSRAVGTIMSVVPKQITVTFGQSFTINMTVSNVDNLFAWQVALKYNATILNCTAAWVPGNDVFSNFTSIIGGPILNPGTVDGYNYTLYSNTLLTAAPVNVSQGVLCSFNFTTEAYGAMSLQIATSANPIRYGNIYVPTTAYSELLDIDQNEMLFTAQDVSLQPMLKIVSTSGGTAAPPPGNYSYTYGTNVSVTANPETSYALNNWLLDNSNVGSANPITILMNANHTLQPIFTQANNYTLTIVGAAGGNTSLPPGTYTYSSGQTVNISATADTGYGFSYWMLDGSQAGSTNPLGVVMDSNHTLAPVFSSTGYVYVYIRADGSIDPPGVPILTSDNVTYELAADMNHTITVQRSNILIVGNGNTLQGGGSGEGIKLNGVTNVTVTNINIMGFDTGIDLSGTSQNRVSETNVTANNGLGISLYNSFNNTIDRNHLTANNGEGIHLDFSSDNNEIFENTIKDNDIRGIYIDSSSGNFVYHNNMVNNTDQVYVAAHGSPANSWNNSMEGNYWSNYMGFDSNSDGIGDTPFVIDANDTDHFPLMGMFSSFSTPEGYFVNIISNSTATNFNYSSSAGPRRISFNTDGPSGTVGFCELTIPHTLMDVGRIEVLIDNGNTPIVYSNLNLRENSTHRWIYFSYQHSTHTIIVQEDITPPAITVLSPENKTYSTNHISLNFTVSEQTSWEGYGLDSSVNVTIAGNTTLTGLPDGSHTITVYANDTVGNMGRSDATLFTVDTAPPNIVVLSPENKTYSLDNVPLNFTVSEQTSWEGYSLDGLSNVTTTGNKTLASIPDGLHSIIVYSNDTAGNMGGSNTIFFTIDTTAPNITQVQQNPAVNDVLPNEMVKVNVTVIDITSGVKSVNLTYAYTTGSPTFNASVSMTRIQGNIWNATIPAFPYGTNVTYTILAEDNAGNNITSQEIGLHYEYEVTPEYSALFILSLLMISSLLTMALTRMRGRNHKTQHRRT